MSKRVNSAVVIARLLSTEGFSDRVSNHIEKYFKKNSSLSYRQKKQLDRLEKELSDMCMKLTEGEKQVLGRFIGLHKKMSFHVGLKIGLTSWACKNSKQVDVDERT